MSISLLGAILVAAGIVGAATVIGAIGVASFVLTSGPPAYRLVITTLLCVTVFFEIAIAVSRPLEIFNDGTQVVTVLTSMIAVFGTLVAASFGIQASSDKAYRTQEAAEKATDISGTVLIESELEAGGRVVRDTRRTALTKLTDLRTQGILTEEEFANAKARLMNE
jgi:hypothetical protein